MKKILILIFSVVLTTSVHSQQDSISDYYLNLETSKELKLTKKQVAEIKRLKNEAKPKFEAIGKDRSLSGYEKGQRKHKLATQLRDDIKKILTPDQINAWEKKYGKLEQSKGIKNTATSNIDTQINKIEQEYDADIKKIMDDYTLNKDQKKEKEKKLKEKYKREKKALKEKKKEVKEIF